MFTPHTAVHAVITVQRDNLLLRATILLASLLIVLTMLSGIATAATMQEAVGASGYVDWQRMRVVAHGMGAVPASAAPAQARFLGTRAATVDARRNLLEVIQGVRVEATTTMRNYLVQDDTIASQVRGYVQGASTDRVWVSDDGVYHVTMSLALTGTLGGTILRMLGTPPAAQPAHKTPPPVISPEMQKRLATLEQQTAALAAQLQALQAALRENGIRLSGMEAVVAEQGTVLQDLATAKSAAPATEPLGASLAAPLPDYTGLVIDARDTGFAPSLRPQLFADEEQIFPSASTNMQIAATEGHVRYMDSITEAQKLPRIGSLPLTLKATGTREGNTGALVFSEADTQTLRALRTREGNLLDSCRIVIVF